MDTLKFCLSIPNSFRLEELYEINNPLLKQNKPIENVQFVLKSVVCFLGAHYMTYIKTLVPITNKQGQIEYRQVWNLYDDYKPVKEQGSWANIVDKMIEYGTLPTVLLYEQANLINQNIDIYDRLSSSQIKFLNAKAEQLQQFMDQFDVNEATNKTEE